MTTIYINFGPSTAGVPSPWIENFFSSNLTVGVAKGDLETGAGDNSGVSFAIAGNTLSVSSNTADVVSALGAFPQPVLNNYAFFASSTNPILVFNGLPPNVPITLSVIGVKNGGGFINRDTEFTVNSNTYLYDNKGNTPPDPPTIFNENSNGSGVLEVLLTGTDAGTFGFLNALTLEYSVATGPSIDNIDGDNEVRAGQQNVVITGSNIENATSVTLGGEALTIV